jgi:short-subunit dehydrogenase
MIATYLFFIIGLVPLFWFVYGVYKLYDRQFVRKEKDLLKRYSAEGEGDKPWAVITGAYGGLGEQYCRQLAAKGFNIVLVGRDKSKLEALAKDIKDVKTKCIAFDFDKATGLDEYKVRIVDELKEQGIKEIGLLVCNAGVMNTGLIHEISAEKALSTCKVNMYHPTAMMRVCLPLMEDRKTRSGVIVVSSICGALSIPSNAVYAATKNYVTNMTHAVEFELKRFKKKVDVQLYSPGFIDTKLASAQKKDARPITRLTMASS